MERTNCLDFKCACLFQKSLHLLSVFADNVEIVSSCFTAPALVGIGCAEFAERVGREKNFVRAVVCNHNLGPMYHRCHHEIKLVCAEVECVALFNGNNLAQINIAKLRQHSECACRAVKNGVGVFLNEFLNSETVVRLKMLNYQIIGLFVA